MLKTGVDIVSVNRIKKAYEKFGDKFVKKILTNKEMESLNKRGDFFAYLSGRFAAKEAIYKAYGKKKLSWQQVEILNNTDGVPVVFIDGKEVSLSVSVSHEKEFAVAFAVYSK
jgi:holo-[acyl-carrier protein] synthase